MNKKYEQYPISSSPFHHLTTQKKVAELLNTDKKTLKKIIENPSAFYYQKDDIINDKPRKVRCPIKALRPIHDRLKELFNRIEQPDYIYSPRKKHTAQENAKAHSGNKVAASIDIRQFYPSTTNEHIFRLFRNDFGLKDDIAGLLTKICTFEGKLPFGSPLSPVLCTFVHKDMFKRIQADCSEGGHTMTVWVDDINVSGDEVTSNLIYKMRKRVAAKGLESHKVSKKSLKKGKVITGTYLKNGRVVPDNKIHLKIKEKLDELKKCSETFEKLSIIRSLIGLHTHCESVYEAANDDEVLKRIKARKSWLHNQRRFLEKQEKSC